MSKNGSRMVVCDRCRNMKLHHARGLCKCCYNHATEAGELGLHPRADETPRHSAPDLGSGRAA